MPPVPSHQASYRGSPLVLEVQHPHDGRCKLLCHSNEYVGLVRRRLAAQINVPPSYLRLLYGGERTGIGTGRGRLGRVVVA